MSRDSPQTPPPELRDALGEKTSDQSSSEDDLTIGELWSLLERAKVPPSALPNASDTWAEVQRHIGSEEPPATDRRPDERRAQRPARSGSGRHVGRRVAATVVVVLAVALGAWWWSQPVVTSAPPGSPVTYTLPDGSVVELNGGTRLSHARTMSAVSFLEAAQRTVRLRGEAYFDVEAEERPFVVRTPTARIEVVGTAFAVRTDESDAETHVSLSEGAVRVEGRDPTSDAVDLRPGEAVRVDSNGAVTPPADTSIERVTAWRRGGFAVTAQALPVVVRSLEQQFGVSIRLSPSIPEDVTSAPLTLYYSQEVGVETILHDLSMARDLSYRPIAGEGYLLTRSQ